MDRKSPDSRYLRHKGKARIADHDWHNGGDIEIHLYARSLQKLARILVRNLDLEQSPKTAWDAGPIILLYGQTLELRLKALVGEGSSVLKRRIDPITLFTTHSMRWLAQVACQIIRAVKWEGHFKCEGVSSLADFTALVNELEALDPVSCAVRPGTCRRDGSVPHPLQPPNVVRLAMKIDALLDLLDVTADALAAMSDEHGGSVAESHELKEVEGGNIKPTIQ